MVLRYKLLILGIAAASLIIWYRGIELFPASAFQMYQDAVLTTTVDYYVVRTASGEIVDDNAAFYVSPYPSGDEIAMDTCFGDRFNVCQDYFKMVADWRGEPVKIEHWRWDYQSGEETLLETVIIPEE